MNYGKKGVHNKQKTLHSTSAKWGKKFALTLLNVVILAAVSVCVLVLSVGFGVFRGIIDTAPDIGNINVQPTSFSTFVYDIDGNQTAKLVAENSNRIPVTMDMIPENLAHAFVAIEDQRFYEHNGIDVKGIIRAGITGITTGTFSEGASTITQQLLKNNVFTDWTKEARGLSIDKIKRKIQEQYLALELEKTITKDEILLNYMNSINLGQNTLGVQAASQRYFNKSVSDLTLSECAVIAGITQNPSRYNPISHPEENKKRRTKVLNHMLEQGYINQTEYNIAIADDVYARIQTTNEEVETTSINTYFVDALTEDVLEDLVAAGYNETQAYTLLYTGGLKIYSTQDPKIQAICDEVFNNEENYPSNVKWYLNYQLTVDKADGERENHSSEMFREYYRQENRNFNLIYSSKEEAYEAIEAYKTAILETGDEVFAEKVTLTPQPQVSLVVEDQSTGAIVAMVGGRGAKEGSRTLNRATDSARQPGSTFKVIADYAPALDNAGLTLATVQNDAPFNYADGTPVRNWYGEAYRGLCTLRLGIQDSLNIVAVKTLTLITPRLGFDYLQNFGISTLVESQEIKGKIYTDIHQSLALGGITIGVTNEELNAAYATIANNGTYIKPKLYNTVVDQQGNVILDNTQPESKQVIKETTAFLLTDAMVDVVTKGTGRSVNFGGMAIAGKTGTTSDYNDVWFAGYTPYYTATTWAGFDNNIKLSGEERNLAKKLWRAVMSKIHEGLPNEPFSVPSGVITATVCAKSGKQAIPGLCSNTLNTEYFADGTVPTVGCDVHYQGPVCQYNGRPSTEWCPFKADGVLELLPVEPAALQSGSAPVAPNTCPHSAEFMSAPENAPVIEQQRAEILQRQIAAQQAAEQAAQQAAQQAAEQAAQQAAQQQPAQ